MEIKRTKTKQKTIDSVPRQLTVAGLIDYLQQFPGTTMVALDDEMANNLPPGDFIVMSAISYQVEG